jgi:signal transduction histidine kinase
VCGLREESRLKFINATGTPRGTLLEVGCSSLRLTSRLRSYSFATAICMAATTMSWISRAPSSCFHLGVVICSLYAENGAGLLSIGLSILSFDYFFLSPRFQFSVEPSAYPRLAAFIATAVCVNLAIAAKQRAERARREALEDRKVARESLQIMEQRLARAAQIATLGEVSASIAHEINQPLTAIIANAHMCSDSLATGPAAAEDARSLVQDILDCGYHATDVVRRMRTLFKSGTLEKTALDINEVVKEVLGLIRSQAGKRRVSLEIDLDTGLPPILADRVQIQQVLMNLCINGLDAMDAVSDRRRTLALRTRCHDQGAIRVEVQDSGVGLRESDRVFEAFFTTKQNGMGMGLPISRSIVELHNGSLWPQSGDTPGTTFCFTLPVLDHCNQESHHQDGRLGQEWVSTTPALTIESAS